jgi:hypothetical protein
MKTSHTIKLASISSSFAEDKDAARNIRMSQILPTLEQDENIVLDFNGIFFATQSFIHALIGEALKKHGEQCLDRIEFRNCSKQLQGLIELVVDYSLYGFPEQDQQCQSIEQTS